MRLLLEYSDNVAFAELRAEYGTDMLKKFAKQINAAAMKNNIYNASAIDLGKTMKEIYYFIESDAEYASFMKDAMMSSIHTVMIGYGVAPKKIAHKYGWDTGAYHDRLSSMMLTPMFWLSCRIWRKEEKKSIHIYRR